MAEAPKSSASAASAASPAAPTTSDKPKPPTLAQVLNNSTQRLVDVLPPHIKPERVIRMALMAAHKNPAILHCSQESVVFSVVQIAAWGLEIGRTAHLVPFKDTCQPIPDYKGLVQMAIQSGEVMSVTGRVVREGDEFDFEFGLEEKLYHKPKLGNTGDIIYAYAVLTLPDGSKKFEVMTRAEIEKVRNSSRAGTSGPWVSWYDQQAIKTVIKRVLKTVPLSERVHDLIEADNVEYQPDGADPARAPRQRGRSSRLAALTAGAGGDDESLGTQQPPSA